jgi:hypothetical protein
VDQIAFVLLYLLWRILLRVLRRLLKMKIHLFHLWMMDWIVI